MCGIVGYIGKKQAKELLLNCLEKLEYRGYDSAGIAISDGTNLKFSKTEGNISKLRQKCVGEDLNGSTGIAHTRWATHGEPSAINSHPHFNTDKTIAVVHNGIIENYEELKKELMETGYKFTTETDTEVIPHLIDYYYNGNILDAAVQTAKRLEGSYAAGILHQSEPDKIIAIKKDSPLISGTSKTGTFIASDISAIIKETKDVYYMENNEFAVLKKDEIKFYNSKKEQIEKKLQKIEISQEAVEKAGFPHYMLKEIYEQPKAVENTLDGQISKDKPTKFGNIEKEQLTGIKKIYIVACGSAYHAGLIGKNAIEKLSGIEVEVNYASEFRYKNTTLNKDTLVVTVTQSGETADTLATIPIAKKKGAKTLAITNVAGSSVTREADMVFYTKAGPEIAVASTKAYLTQLTAMYIFAIFLGEITSFTSSAFLNNIKKELSEVVFCIKNTLELNNQIKSTAKEILKKDNIFYLGRGNDYAVAMEGALKLKETAYVHCEAYHGGELKHGPIALIEDGTIVIAINTTKELQKKTDSNIKEVISRGAKVIGIVPEGYGNSYYKAIYIPKANEILYPLISSIPLQLLAYHISAYKKYDVDKPKNLAKSVTVE